MAKYSNAKITDPSWYISAGINPKTGLPLKLGNKKSELLSNVKMTLRIKDEQMAVNRYNWFNTGLDLNSQEIERFLYYKYSLIFFFLEGKFYVMPYALNGGLDFYGRENEVNPVPFSGEDSEATRKQKELLSKIRLKVRKGVLEDDPTLEDWLTSAVIIKDYTPQSNITKAIPRCTLQEGIIDFESRIFPYMRTAMMNSTGVQGVKVSDEGEIDDVIEGANAVDEAALNGAPWIPLLSKLDRQQINAGGTTRSEDYLMAMQGVDNYRESLYGLDQQGLFTKKAHTNDSENAMNTQLDFPLVDGLKLRQDACNIINSIWGIGIWCELSETATGADRNGDLYADDGNQEPANRLNVQEGVQDESN